MELTPNYIRPGPFDSDWEPWRPVIEDLYLGQRLSCNKVMEIMEQRHHFIASSKQYKSRFQKWGWAKNFTGTDAKQIVSGTGGASGRRRPDKDPKVNLEKAERSMKRKQNRENSTMKKRRLSTDSNTHLVSPLPKRTCIELILHTPPPRASTLPQFGGRELDLTACFLGELRNFTHEASKLFVHSRANSSLFAEHDGGRQASRLFSSDLTAGTSLYVKGKHELANVHWKRARAVFQNSNLFRTWYHETPIRLLFEIGRVAHCGHHELAASLMQDIRSWAQTHLEENDLRRALFVSFSKLPIDQLKNIYERAANSMRIGLETRIDKHSLIRYDTRLHRALDLLWFDSEADLKKWLPPVEEVDKALGSDNPYSVYFLLLEAYRLVALGLYSEADSVCSEVSRRLSILIQVPGSIDAWKVGLAYRRLGRQLHEKGRYQDARVIFNTALTYLGENKSSVLIEIYQYQEKLAVDAEDEEDIALWQNKLSKLEQETMEHEASNTPSRFEDLSLPGPVDKPTMNNCQLDNMAISLSALPEMSNNIVEIDQIGRLEYASTQTTDPADFSSDTGIIQFNAHALPNPFPDSDISPFDFTSALSLYTNDNLGMPFYETGGPTIAPGDLAWNHSTSDHSRQHRSFTA